jgi:hypothetical protein
MKSYIKTHKNAKALSKHKTKLRSRGAKITVTGLTILYSFPSKAKSLGPSDEYMVHNNRGVRNNW